MASGGKSKSESSQVSQQFVDPNQVPFLQFLRQQGQALAQSQQGIGDVASQLSGRLGGIGGELLGGIQSAAGSFGPGVGQSISGLLNFAGQGGGIDLQSLLEPGAQLPGALSSLDEAIQRNLGSTLGTIGGQATLQGQTGGDRQAFFSSEAGAAAQREFAGGAAALIGSDLASRRQLGGVAAGLDVASRGQDLSALTSAGGLGLAQQGQNVGAAGAGISALGPLFNLGLGGFNAAFNPLLAFAQILGNPTILGTQTGAGSGSSQQFAIGDFTGGGG